MRPRRRTLAVNLLLEGQRALVVGGGRVGLRKTQTLLAAGVEVRLVCPVALEAFEGLAVEWRKKVFDPSDLEGCVLVFACTDDKHVNRVVLEAARAQRVQCCCADGHWSKGDFIVPATFTTSEAKVSVSTDGRSCRSAKELKEALQRFLEQSTAGELFIFGVREAAGMPLSLEVLGERLRFLSGLYEWALLRTCHRTEFIAWATPALIRSGLLQHVFHFPSSAYAYRRGAAMRHLTYVLAGLDSRMIGEFHIVGQVRDALDEARVRGWARGALPQAYAEAYQRAQLLRGVISPYLPQIEVEALALEGATGRVVIAGTGRLGMATARQARAMGLEVTLLYHSRPTEGEWDCRPLSAWREALEGATRLITACTMEQPYFNAEEIAIPMVDLGAPRNIAGERNVRDLDCLRGDYLERTGSVEKIRAVAEAAYNAEGYENE